MMVEDMESQVGREGDGEEPEEQVSELLTASVIMVVRKPTFYEDYRDTGWHGLR